MPTFNKISTLAVIGLFLLSGCFASSEPDGPMSESGTLPLKSYWIKEHHKGVMLDPQTSGLTLWRDGTLLSIADGSADKSQILRLLQIDPDNRTILSPKLPIVVAEDIANSCFGEYMSNRPDLEALVVDPDDDTLFYSVTEDASRWPLSEACQNQYADSGSTDYPTLLVRLKLDEESQTVLMSHVRPLQYAKSMGIGNYPNDGIEGMTFGEGRTLYLALEKDARYQPRIFSVEMKDEFWQSADFHLVTEQKLKIPQFNDKMPHPINGLTYYHDGATGWLVAAARNDNEIWLIDSKGSKDTAIIPVSFLAETQSDGACNEYELMNNYSMEGLAIKGDKLWLINDPWKQNYGKNIQCAETAENYQKMAPLLTWIPLETVNSYIK